MDAQTYKKTSNTVLYLLRRSAAHRPAMTVLLKMLWYVDYLHYGTHLASITGARYVALKRGPVLDDYKNIFERMEREGLMTQEREASQRFPETPTQYFSAVGVPDIALFKAEEIDTMEEVIATCAHRTGSSLSRLTHGTNEPWTLVWDEESEKPAPIPEVLWRWSDNLPDSTDLALAREDVSRPQVRAALEKIWAAQRAKTPS